MDPITNPVDQGIVELLMGPMGGLFAAGMIVGVGIGWQACSYVFNTYKISSMKEELEELKEELKQERTERKKLAEEIREIHRMLMKQ